MVQEVGLAGRGVPHLQGCLRLDDGPGPGGGLPHLHAGIGVGLGAGDVPGAGGGLPHLLGGQGAGDVPGAGGGSPISFGAKSLALVLVMSLGRALVSPISWRAGDVPGPGRMLPHLLGGPWYRPWSARS